MNENNEKKKTIKNNIRGNVFCTYNKNQLKKIFLYI